MQKEERNRNNPEISAERIRQIYGIADEGAVVDMDDMEQIDPVPLQAVQEEEQKYDSI